MSQVVLSLQLGYAVIPLIQFVSDKKTMGKFVIPPITKIGAWAIASVLVFLNLKMLFNEFTPIFAADAWLPKCLIGLAILFFGSLLLYIILHPYLQKTTTTASILMHDDAADIGRIQKPVFEKIAIALDFSSDDSKLLSYAIGQGQANTEYLLLHIVESAGAKISGDAADDYESRKDKEKMDLYISQLRAMGYNATSELGYKNRVKEIVRIVKSNKADMLVLGAHGHTGLKDFIYGTTVDAVRHEVNIPVLVVTL
jgi:manganese transport protein